MNSLEYQVLQVLCTRTKRALRKTRRNGKAYMPRIALIKRISVTFKVSEDTAMNAILSVGDHLRRFS